MPRLAPRRARTLTLLAAMALTPWLVACGREREVPPEARDVGVATLPSRPNLLLVTVDTLRADHLSAWGYPRATSPVLDQLARDGVRFDQAHVQWPKTGPSFASMMTATYPKDNGIVRHVGIPLPCTLRTLAEELSALGYQTVAVVANGAIGREFYFDQGFGRYHETWKILEEEKPRRRKRNRLDPNRAERVTDLALEAGEDLDRTRPFFLWVHYLDPHAPYAPPRDQRDRFQGDEHYDPTGRVRIDSSKYRREIGAIGKGDVVEGRDELGFYVARYDAEIRYTDAEIGRLLDGFRDLGLDRNRLTVFTADHGESLGEHNYYFAHGRLAFQTCLRVPLVFHWPEVLHPRVDAAPVGLIDLAPTLLAIAGKELSAGRWAQGASLGERLQGLAQPSSEEPVFSESGYGQNGRWIRVVRQGRFKLIFAPLERDQIHMAGRGIEFTLYDLEADPGETTDVAAANPEVVDRLRRSLRSWSRAPRFPVASDVDTCDEGRQMDQETEDLLRSLGYL